MPGQKTCSNKGCNTPLQDGWRYCPQCSLLVVSDEEREAERLDELVSAYFKSKPKSWGLMTVAERGEIICLLKAVRVLVASEEDGRGTELESEEVSRRWKDFLDIAAKVPLGYQAALGNAARLLVESEVCQARRLSEAKLRELVRQLRSLPRWSPTDEADENMRRSSSGEWCYYADLELELELEKMDGGDHGEGAERDDNEG